MIIYLSIANLTELKTYHEVVDEIYYKVQHLEPWEKGSRKTSGQTGMCGGVSVQSNILLSIPTVFVYRFEELVLVALFQQHIACSTNFLH